MRRLAPALLVGALLLASALLLLPREDDVVVDRYTPTARRAVAEALRVVPGRVVEVARDRDNGKWEVIVAYNDGEYEVELDPRTFELLRLDYD
jgi:uncharacterized membrane protein YkoI